MSFGLYKQPDGKGRMRCIKFEDYKKFGWTDETLIWWEDHEILIFPFK
jgi:hypothetical protein